MNNSNIANANVNQHNKYTIHIVDDSKYVIRFLAKLLQEQGYNVSFTTNGKNALDAIIKTQPTLIILDVEMPIMDGYETIQNLKKTPETAHIPVIFHTMLTQPQTIKKLFELGAADYISKPAIPEELLARVDKEIRNIVLQNLVKEKMSKLGEAISKDTLTRTSNRIHMTSIINRRMHKLETEHQGVFSLIYIDIDDFNYFNKINGFKTSDRALQKFSTVVKACLRSDDILSRWEGDRFMILLPLISKARLKEIAKDILHNVEHTHFSPITSLTCSIALVELSTANNISTIIGLLQSKMKAAKAIRKNTILTLEQNMLQPVSQALE